jgi:hypothetical protein
MCCACSRGHLERKVRSAASHASVLSDRKTMNVAIAFNELLNADARAYVAGRNSFVLHSDPVELLKAAQCSSANG